MAQFDSLLRQLQMKLERQQKSVVETESQIKDLREVITAGLKK